jgi:hypothetical protein
MGRGRLQVVSEAEWDKKEDRVPRGNAALKWAISAGHLDYRMERASWESVAEGALLGCSCRTATIIRSGKNQVQEPFTG